MGAPPTSQAAPLPTHLPFRLISKTIGSGAYASIRKAVPLKATAPVIAIKFINKAHAFKAGRLKPKQLQLELAIHASVGGQKHGHPHIITYLAHGEDSDWVWLALELADGGDLFDKIEADAGVPPDVAHLYFTQLVSAIGWVHGKGVAHRDIKPENMLLSKSGDLKLADFGLATQFMDVRSGKKKVCGLVCGSPPYIAPEILAVGTANLKRKGEEQEKAGYDPMRADLWSCAIVLFVLLVGNTPWDSPVMEESYEYHDYVTSHGRPSDELWHDIPADALGLLRAMLDIDPTTRATLPDIRAHPWFARANPHLDARGRAANPVLLAQEMLENLQIRFDAPAMPLSQREQRRDQQSQQSQRDDPMDIDDAPSSARASTQPMTPIAEAEFGWEPRPAAAGLPPSNAQTSAPSSTTAPAPFHPAAMDDLSQDPSMSQFTGSVPFSLTQAAQQFNQLLPAANINWFPSVYAPSQLRPLLRAALRQCHVVVVAGPPFFSSSPSSSSSSSAASDAPGGESEACLPREGDVESLRIHALDVNGQALHGEILIARTARGGLAMLDVEFRKAKGDPMGWRRLFKRVAVLCRDAVYFPRAGE